MSRPKIIYDATLIKLISLFEAITGAQVKDCFVSRETLHFVVDPEHMGRAIGKDGKNAKKAEAVMKRKIKVLEYSPDLATFIKNMVYPLTTREITVRDSHVIIAGPDTKTKALLIGRNSANINAYKDIIRRYFDIADLKVV
ncbi:NusA-like transcription termination signal-binding factor [Candidatus Woesearchaeota archaeon]|nr:NusA-like transcription termination signal-binding factor [Candidatus Woesearchaeota archaeon]